MFRHPLSKQGALLTILKLMYFIGALILVADLGIFIEDYIIWAFPNSQNDNESLALIVSILLALDFIAKLVLRGSRFPFVYLYRFPGSKMKLYCYSVISEYISPWNFYLVIFFSYYLTSIVYPEYGLAFVVLAYTNLYSLQLLNSVFVTHLKSNKKPHNLLLLLFVVGTIYLYTCYRQRLYLSLSWQTSTLLLSQALGLLLHYQNILKKRYTHDEVGVKIRMLTYLPRRHRYGTIFRHILFNLTMVWRSPVLRKQLLTYLVLSSLYLYLFYQKPILFEHHTISTVLVTLLLSLFPLLFNQFIFSAEAAFFDKLALTTNLSQYLASKYLLYVGFSLLSFLGLLICIQASVHIFTPLNLISMLLYSSGTITLLSFSSILIANTRVELFNSHRTWSSPPTGQTLIVILSYGLAITIVIGMQILVSEIAATYYMLICGLISLVCFRYWLNLLLKKFHTDRHKRMEIFRSK